MSKEKLNNLSADGVNGNVDSVMRQFDRESNTRIWSGKPKLIVDGVLALFSLYSI